MTPEDYKTIILDRIIADLTALKYADGTSKVFGAVNALFIKTPDSAPICEVLPGTFVSQIDGLSENTRVEGFEIYVSDTLEESATNEQSLAKIRRFTTIQGILLDYIEKLPSTIEYPAVNIHLYAQGVPSGQILVSTLQNGVSLVLNVVFEVKVIVNARLIS